MTRLFTTGFETGASEWNGATSTNPGVSFSDTYVRTGNYSLRLAVIALTMTGSYFRHVFDDEQTELYGRFAYYIDSGSSVLNFRVVDFRDSLNGQQFAIHYNAGTQTLGWYNGAGALLAMGNVIIPADCWIVVEFHVVIGSSGSLTLKVNSTTDAVWSGDTDYTNDKNVQSMYWLAYATSSAAVNQSFCYIDDIGVNNADGTYQNSWLGLGGCFFLKPTADGAHTDWTPSEGTDHYDDVDEIPPNTTDWVQALDLGDIDTYAVEDCPPYIDVINLVQVLYRAAVITSGANTLEDVVRQGGSDYNGVSHVIVPLIPAYTFYPGETHYVQPDGSGAWSIADVDALEVGMEIVA